jgi:RNA polymerase sigma-70 factor (ECF subfamily)
VGTVKSRCARGRARLAPQLTHLRSGNGDGEVPETEGNRTPRASVPPAAGPRDEGTSDPAAAKGGGGHA